MPSLTIVTTSPSLLPSIIKEFTGGSSEYGSKCGYFDLIKIAMPNNVMYKKYADLMRTSYPPNAVSFIYYNIASLSSIDLAMFAGDVIIEMCDFNETKFEKNLDVINKIFPTSLARLCSYSNSTFIRISPNYITTEAIKQKSKGKSSILQYLQNRSEGDNEILKYKTSILLKHQPIIGYNDTITASYCELRNFPFVFVSSDVLHKKIFPIHDVDFAKMLFVLIKNRLNFTGQTLYASGLEETTIKRLIYGYLTRLDSRARLIPLPSFLGYFNLKFLKTTTNCDVTKMRSIKLYGIDGIPHVNIFNVCCVAQTKLYKLFGSIVKN